MVKPRVIMLATLALLGMARPAIAHPMHSTITELSEDRARGTVRAMIRVFSDDFNTVLSRARGVQRDRATSALAYVASSFVLADKGGKALTLRSCGMREASGVVWICVEGDSREGLALLRLKAAVLCDLYDDQINVVQATVGGSRRSFLFTRGAGLRPIV